MFNGEPGAIPKVIGHWMLRSALIMPGLALAGVRDYRLVTSALISSTFVSGFLIFYTAFERHRRKHRRKGRDRGGLRSARTRRALAYRRRVRQLAA